MPIDLNEAPEGMIAVEHLSDECPGEVCLLFGKNQCHGVKCHAAQRKDNTGCYFIEKPQPTETKTMEDEYEYLDANTESDFKILSSWMFGDLLEVRRTLVTEGPPISSVWENANGEIKMYRTYRRKKQQPKKTKKLVPRTAEELTQLIGKCLIRMKTTPGIVHLLIDNDYDGDQEHWEMCYIGECVWMPMMKEVEVEE